MTATAGAPEAWSPTPVSHREWAALSAEAPQLAATMRRYLVQLTTFLAPRSVDAADDTLRQFARWLGDHTDVTAIADVHRGEIEDHEVWLAAQPGAKSPSLSKNTRRQRLRTIRLFLERLIEWDWPDAPTRNPILHGDIPPRPEPLPKFLDDRDAARLVAAARAHRLPRYRLVVEMLARTGLRASERCDLAADAVTQIGDGHWLRVPVGKLRSHRFVPLHPELVELLGKWTATNATHIRRQRRLLADHHAPLDRRTVHRIVATVAKKAGIGHAHPHQLRHTLATQAINRGMRLEAIAALLGHRSMEMTLTYARIADRVVADEYQAVTAQIDALYDAAGVRCPPRSGPLPWPASDAKRTPACSATGSAPDRSSASAARNQPARPAPTSGPGPSSSPSFSASATTTSPTAPPSSTGFSNASPARVLDKDHP